MKEPFKRVRIETDVPFSGLCLDIPGRMMQVVYVHDEGMEFEVSLNRADADRIPMRLGRGFRAIFDRFYLFPPTIGGVAPGSAHPLELLISGDPDFVVFDQELLPVRDNFCVTNHALTAAAATVQIDGDGADYIFEATVNVYVTDLLETYNYTLAAGESLAVNRLWGHVLFKRIAADATLSVLRFGPIG